jgi:hypothetical protein
MAAADPEIFRKAAELIGKHGRIVIKVGGGARRFGDEIRRLAETAGAAVPGSLGVLPNAHAQNMHVGGSKGSISGNFAMENATLLAAIGTRAVCQSDCSGVGYPKARAVINLNGDFDDLTHYNNTLAVPGDIGVNLNCLIAILASEARLSPEKKAWLAACVVKKAEWAQFKRSRFEAVAPIDDAHQRRVMTQPQAVKVAANFASEIGAVKLFDAGDVQANGFQIVEDDQPFETFTETGASFMGFATAALMASAIADRPRYPIAFSGDGSFMMNPQVLLDGTEHHLRGTHSSSSIIAAWRRLLVSRTRSTAQNSGRATAWRSTTRAWRAPSLGSLLRPAAICPKHCIKPWQRRAPTTAWRSFTSPSMPAATLSAASASMVRGMWVVGSKTSRTVIFTQGFEGRPSWTSALGFLPTTRGCLQPPHGLLTSSSSPMATLPPPSYL